MTTAPLTKTVTTTTPTTFPSPPPIIYHHHHHQTYHDYYHHSQPHQNTLEYNNPTSIRNATLMKVITTTINSQLPLLHFHHYHQTTTTNTIQSNNTIPSPPTSPNTALVYNKQGQKSPQLLYDNLSKPGLSCEKGRFGPKSKCPIA